MPNSSFAEGSGVPTGWTNVNISAGSVKVARDASIFASGPASLRLDLAGAGASPIGEGNVNCALPVMPGKTLNFSGKIRSSGPGVQEAQVAFFVQDEKYQMVLWQPVASRYDFKDGEWASFSKSVKVPSNAKNCLLILFAKGKGSVWLDDAVVEDASEPLKPTGTKSNLIEIVPVTERILAIQFKEGKVTYHKMGQPRGADSILYEPLDVARAKDPATYRISSDSDAAFKGGKQPVKIGRKSKGVEFAWFVDSFVNGKTVNERPDHIKQHWIYLTLPAPMKPGQTYTVQTGGLAKGSNSVDFKFDLAVARSESVHVNLLGYVPGAPSKFGYVYQWLGDMGSLDLKPFEGKEFWLLDTKTGNRAFTGKLAFRKDRMNPETEQPNDTPNRNFLQADVYECDFSAFNTPGSYKLVVDGIGSSRAFKLDTDVYREAFKTTVRGLYHNRSGIALTAPYTKWTRPAPHNPLLTPGFAGKLKYTTSRYIDWINGDNDPADKPAIEAGIKGPIDVWGWYQDAGDWDSYSSHIRVAQELLLAYQLAPKNYAAGELNIPESKNGLPDIVNEAAWLPRFCYRLRSELLKKKWGTGGIGLRICGDHFGRDTGPKDVGQGSWLDVDRTWIVSGEDPVSTFNYAGAAAQMARTLKMIGKPDPEKIDWEKEAKESYAWAVKNSKPQDIKKGILPEPRGYAAAALFVLTGEKAYEDQLKVDFASLSNRTPLFFESFYGPALYTLGGGPKPADPELLVKAKAAVLATADACLETANKRALRWGGNISMPMLIGQQTTPWVQGLAVGSVLTRNSDPAKSKAYLGAVYTTCDYFLGTNPLNTTWVTGLGPRSPWGIFHMDSWYSGQSEPVPGVIPYGQWLTQSEGAGPWDHDWANHTMYPSVEVWPGAERWHDNRCSPMSGEFTIHQNTAPAAAIFGFLCAARG